jgi:hypothetical protein
MDVEVERELEGKLVKGVLVVYFVENEPRIE